MEFAATFKNKCTPPETLCRSTCRLAPTGAPISCGVSRSARQTAGLYCAACSRSLASHPASPRLNRLPRFPAAVARKPSLRKVEIDGAILGMVPRAIERHHHQSVTPRRYILHTDVQSHRHHRTALLK